MHNSFIMRNQWEYFNIFKKKPSKSFSPDLSLSEYENWLAYVKKGCTTDEWERLKRENHWSSNRIKQRYF